MDSYAFNAQVSRVSPIGLSPGIGLRIDVGFVGTITEGPLTGQSMEGIDYLLIREDGVAVIDARELIATGEGPHISIQARGYIIPPFALPPLAALLQPDFVWPDADMSLHGAAFPTAGAERDELNRTVYAFTGTVNMGTGQLMVQATSLTAAALT